MLKYKVGTGNLIALKFGAQKSGVRAHLFIKLQLILVKLFATKLHQYYHTHKVNHTWQEAENWYRSRLIMEPHTFCSLKEIELRIIKIYQKNQQCVTIM